jgi:hypothetical protein
MQIPEEYIRTTINFNSYNFALKWVFLAVFILQTTGLMFPEVATNAVVGSMTITTMTLALIMFNALWGAICYGLSGTKLGMWTFRGK